MTGYIDRANAGARAAESLTRGGALGYGMSQTREGEASSMEQLLNQLRAGSYPR
jgi:hypothetical protein